MKVDLKPNETITKAGDADHFINGINIITKTGDEIRFKVKNRNSWCEVINKIY